MFPDLPDQKNLPLQIKGHTPGPDREQTVISGGACTPTPISVTVFEPNADDSTTSLWYIDRSTNSAPTEPSLTVFGGSNNRVISATPRTLNQLSTLADGKRHVLEVFVTDGVFNPDDVTTASRRPYGRAPDGGLLADTAYVDTYLWLLQVERCP